MISAVPSGLGTILAITPNVETLGYCRVIPPGSFASGLRDHFGGDTPTSVLVIKPNVETLGYCRVIPPGSRKSKFKIKGKEQGGEGNLQTVRTDSLPNGLRLPNVLPPH
jgi:hypothetical protein